MDQPVNRLEFLVDIVLDILLIKGCTLEVPFRILWVGFTGEGNIPPKFEASRNFIPKHPQEKKGSEEVPEDHPYLEQDQFQANREQSFQHDKA